MSAQPKALLLAELLEAGPRRSGDAGIAAELRRLHAENEHLKGNSLAAAFGVEQGLLDHMTGMAERLAKADALLRQALEALATDDWQKKLMAANVIRQHMEGKA